MTEEKVASNTHTMVQRLEELRIEHMSLINSLESPKTEKSDIILKNIKYIDVGLDEAQLMMEFTSHLQNVEIEKQKLNAQIKQLSQDNDNLQLELSVSHEKLQTFEKTVAELEKEKMYLELAISSCDIQNLERTQTTPLAQTNELASDELQGDESDCTLTPTATSQNDDPGSAEYEFLTRFRSLQKLATHYAAEGKFEVAVPVCKQALDDLKKTTIGRHHPYVSTMMSIVGFVYGLQNKYKTATKLLNDVIREKTQPDVLDSVCNEEKSIRETKH